MDASARARGMLQVVSKISEIIFTENAMPYRLGLDVGLSGLA